MKRITVNAVRMLLAGLLVAAGVLGLQTGALSAPPASVAQASCGDTSGFAKVNLSQLPPEATDTVNLIKKGGPYPYPQDGQVFDNREGVLPDCQKGYYHEYTVKTPGSDDRGARRFVTGEKGEYFYTDDHYKSFKLTNVDA
ncbi:ribonuclease [Saccharopolyspora rosea]|uniref:ribonuclease n=1 Tax=Saccharopolyspora rosea TaxID=524884 RepID=UPI0021D8DD53|nr:ribonuclease [Saccharopolyspora rosea]